MLTTTKLYDIFHIVNGVHGDPHTVLGMHEIEQDGKKMVTVRAFLCARCPNDHRHRPCQ